MTLTFETETYIIVYALEKIICYARKNQYIFVAQSVWWIASVIELIDGLTTHIDNLRIRSEAYKALIREVEQLSSGQGLTSTLQYYSVIITNKSSVHPDRISQIDTTVNESNEIESCESESDRSTLIIHSAKRFIDESRKERRALKQRPCVLSRTRSGKIPVKPLTKKQRNRLGAISKDTLSAYMSGRK